MSSLTKNNPLTRRFRRSLRRLKFTRSGKWFVAMTLMIGFGAINTNNNLLFLMLGMMLGLIIISGMMSEAVLRKLTVERVSVGPAFVGQKAKVEYQLSNKKRLFPSLSIEIREIEQKETKKRRLEALSCLAAGDKVESDKLEGVPCCFVHWIGRKTTVVRGGSVIFPQRGVYRYRSLELATRFPFGFFEKAKRIDRSGEILVMPRQVPAPAVSLPPKRPIGAIPTPRGGRGLEYFALRNYLQGEDWRRIHWKVSARRGVPIVRENQLERSRQVALLLYTVRRPDVASGPTSAVECAIEVAAALARQLLQEDYAVTLATVSGNLGLVSTIGQLGRILRALALLEVDVSDTAIPLSSSQQSNVEILIYPEGESPPLPGRKAAQLLGVKGQSKEPVE